MASNWKDIAKDKQIAFKKSLGYTKSGTYGKKNKEYENFLHSSDAQNGGNFYCHNNPKEWQALREWAKEDKGERVNFVSSDMVNLVDSKHIPYNFIFPLEKLRQEHPDLVNTFLETLLSNKIQVDKVNRIKIDFASDMKKHELLDDNTHFDAYIEYESGESKCALGIGFKYAEKSYPYDKREKARMFDQEDSIYHVLTRDSYFFVSEKVNELRTDQLKQLWRSHLLGLKLAANKQLNDFRSVHIYPEANTYQAEASEKYNRCLRESKRDYFFPITFEKFVITAENVFASLEGQEWIAYLRNRY